VVFVQHVDAALGDEIDGVLGTPVDLGVAALAAVSAGLGDGQALYSEGLEGVLDLVEPVRLHDGGDELHASTFLLWAGAGAGAAVAREPPAVPPEPEAGAACSAWSMPATSSSSGTRMPMVLSRRRARTAEAIRE